MFTSYLTPKAIVSPTIDAGFGARAIEAIATGETVAAFGGWVAPRSIFDTLTREAQGLSIQIDDELYLVAPVGTDGDRINHSCAPNCGLRGGSVVVAMRDIGVGEELSYDYAMSDSTDYDEFECRCGAGACRGKVTGRDWLDPGLQARYRGYFSPYLARRIAALVPAGAGRRAFAY